MHTNTHIHSSLQLLVMLSSAAAQDDGGRLCMALPGEMSHTQTHILGGIWPGGGGELEACSFTPH